MLLLHLLVVLSLFWVMLDVKGFIILRCVLCFNINRRNARIFLKCKIKKVKTVNGKETTLKKKFDFSKELYLFMRQQGVDFSLRASSRRIPENTRQNGNRLKTWRDTGAPLSDGVEIKGIQKSLFALQSYLSISFWGLRYTKTAWRKALTFRSTTDRAPSGNVFPQRNVPSKTLGQFFLPFFFLICM